MPFEKMYCKEILEDILEAISFLTYDELTEKVRKIIEVIDNE